MSRILVFRVHGQRVERIDLAAGSFNGSTSGIKRGTYTVFRLYPGCRVLRLKRHFSRLRASALTLRIPFSLSNEQLREAIRQTAAASRLDTARVRLAIPYETPDKPIITLEPYEPPSRKHYSHGVQAGLAENFRRRPRTKDARSIGIRQKLRARHPDIFEILLFDDLGRILEGASSNFYGVIGGILRTAGEEVLEGIARSIVLEIAPDILPISSEPVGVDEVPRLNEAFLTSSTRGVLPIVRIGETSIGSGHRGVFTAELQAAYDAQVASELGPL